MCIDHSGKDNCRTYVATVLVTSSLPVDVKDDHDVVQYRTCSSVLKCTSTRYHHVTDHNNQHGKHQIILVKRNTVRKDTYLDALFFFVKNCNSPSVFRFE